MTGDLQQDGDLYEDDWRDDLHVFPVRDKVPMVAWRQESAPWDEWTGRWPEESTGWGIDTGKSGLVVIDEDVMAAVTEWLGYVPLTYTVRTGRGRHFYFRPPADVAIRNSTHLAPGVDLRGDGGYVVGPGSQHPSGGRYEVENGGRPAPLPDDILRRLRVAVPDADPSQVTPAPSPRTMGLRIAGAVRKVAEAPPMEGNNTLNVMSGVVGALTADALPEVQQAAGQALVETYLARSSSTHTRAEAQATVDSGTGWGATHPSVALGPGRDRGGCTHSPPCPDHGKHDRLVFHSDNSWALSIMEGLVDDGRRFRETDLSAAPALPPARYFSLGDGRKLVRPGDLVYLHGMNAAGKSPTLDLLGMEHLREDPDCLWILFDYELGWTRQRARLLAAGFTLEQIQESIYYVDHPSLLTDRGKDVLAHDVMDKAEKYGKVPRLMTWDTYSRSCSQMPGADPEKNAYINAWFTTHPDWAKTMFEEVTGQPLTQYVTDHPNREDDITPGGGHAKQDRVVTDVWLRRGSSFATTHEKGRSDYVIAKNGHGDFSIAEHVATLRNRIVDGVSRFCISPHHQDPSSIDLDLTRKGRDSAAEIEMQIIAKLRQAATTGLQRTEITGTGGSAPDRRVALDQAVDDGVVTERKDPSSSTAKRYWLPGNSPS